MVAALNIEQQPVAGLLGNTSTALTGVVLLKLCKLVGHGSQVQGT